MTCSVNEAKQKITPQAFIDWLTFFETNPPMREHLNNCQANIAYTIAAVNRGKGQRKSKATDFRLDYKEAIKTKEQKVTDKINKFFGGLANGKKQR